MSSLIPGWKTMSAANDVYGDGLFASRKYDTQAFRRRFQLFHGTHLCKFFLIGFDQFGAYGDRIVIENRAKQG